MSGTNDHKRAADYVAERLFEAGCRYAFGMPGGEVLTIIDALEKAGIKFVLTKHENSAGFMAEGVMHCTGALAILVATVGPGAVNGVNVVANAKQDRVPMIVLTGCLDRTDALTYTHQVMDHQAVFQSITKATFRLTADGADTVADKAIAIATEKRCGPVHIDVPISVADARASQGRIRRRTEATPNVPCEGKDIHLAREWLKLAKRPLMIAGLDAVADEAGEPIKEFCEKHGVPLITTYKGKGLVSESHELALGAGGLSPLADKTLLPLILKSDLIICAGYDPIEMRLGWRDIWDPTKTNVIDISPVSNLHYMHQSTVSFVSDVGLTLEKITEGVPRSTSWEKSEIKKAKADLAKAFEPERDWGPAKAILKCRELLPDSAIATADSGAHRILLSQIWTCHSPRKLLQSSGLCTMGCAVPLAIGAKIVSPDTQVISFSGDAGMLMVAGELSTAKELGGNIIFVVFVDASLSLIEIKQRGRNLDNIGVDFAEHDFAAIGKAFGGNGFTVNNEEELETALRSAMSDNLFTVIAVVIDRKAYDGRI